MTCIAGIAQNGKVWMGGDSGTCGEVSQVDAIPKVVKRNGVLIGTCGDARLADLMRFCLKVPRLKKDEDVDSFMASRFTAAIRKCFSDHAYPHKEYDSAYDGMMLVGIKGRLYEVDGNYALSRVADGYNAIGSGAQVALGALEVTQGEKAEKRLEAALRASAKYCDGVLAPFTIESV